MAKQQRKHGKAVGTLTDSVTGEVTGWLYEWDNGQSSRLMKASLPPRPEGAAEPDRGTEG